MVCFLRVQYTSSIRITPKFCLREGIYYCKYREFDYGLTRRLQPNQIQISAPVPQTPPQTKMVARGVWFDSSAAIRDIRILHRDKRRIEVKISGDAVVPSDEFNDIFQMFFGSDAANRDKRPVEAKPGAAFRSPDWTSPNLLSIMPPQYEVGNFYYVQPLSSSAERGTYRDIETYFNTYEEAIHTANV